MHGDSILKYYYFYYVIIKKQICVVHDYYKYVIRQYFTQHYV